MKTTKDTLAFEPENNMTGDPQKDQPANGRISLFKNDDEKLHFYLHLSQLFCPHVLRYPEERKQLAAYKHKLKRIRRCLAVVQNFPWKEDFSILHLGVAYVLMDTSVPKAQKQELIKKWCRVVEYMKAMWEYSAMLEGLQTVFSEQKQELKKLLELFPAEEALLIEEMENEENTEEP